MRLSSPTVTIASSGGHRTWCKLCDRSIRERQPAVWLDEPMGLSHAECAERAGKGPR